MHNRVAFATEEWPFANMDGFELLIGFQSIQADLLAVVQERNAGSGQQERGGGFCLLRGFGKQGEGAVLVVIRQEGCILESGQHLVGIRHLCVGIKGLSQPG
jgi:hypothetical protein